MADEAKRPTAQDNVNHPAHYGGEADPYEAIKVIEAWGLGFHLGNAVKYIARAGKKGDMGEDLEKARWYIDRLLVGAADVVPEADAEGERVPEVEAPEDAGDDVARQHATLLDWLWRSGVLERLEEVDELGASCPLCHTLPHAPDCPVRPDSVQPPTDPEARVRAMSDEEVADALVGFGVDRHWSRFTGAMEGQRRLYYTAGNCDEAVSEGGYCWRPGQASRKFNDVRGDTTSEAGRAECSRRLLVHLLRRWFPGEVKRG